MENEIMYLKLDDIIPNRFQPRQIFDEKALQELADSIKQHGVIEPIIVRPISNKFEIVAGERRYKASALAGLTKIPAIVKVMDDKESSIVAFIENAQRKDVSAIEEARTTERILKTNNMTQEELAKELGISQSTLANKLRLLTLPVEVQESLMKNEISERHARSLLSVKDEKKQIELLNKIKEKRMTVRELDSEIKMMNGNNMNNNFGLNTNDDYMSFVNSYKNDNNVGGVVQANSGSIVTPIPETMEMGESNNGEFTKFLNNYDANHPVGTKAETPANGNGDFMNFLNNYDANHPVGAKEEIPTMNNTELNVNSYLNSGVKDNSVMINNVNPPITTNFNANSYVEDNPNYVDVSKATIIDNVDTIINELKATIEKIKNQSKFKVDTDEIDFDDVYQITIKIDKRETL